MRPSKLAIKNLGLVSGEFEIPQILLITGSNRSGKTTLIKAIEFVYTGTVYDPEQNRNLTFDELTPPGANELIVKMGFDNGFWIERKLVKTVKKDKVTVSTFIDFDGISQNAIKSPRAAEAELRAFLSCSQYGLHITEIIEAKTADRRKILLNMLVGTEDTRPLPEWIYEQSIELNGVQEGDYDQLEKLVLDAVESVPSEIMILDRITRINGVVDERHKNAKETLEEITTIIRDLGFDKAETVDTSEIPELEEVLKNTNDDIEELSKYIGSAEADKVRHDQLQEDIKKIKSEISELGVIRNREDIENDMEGLISEKEEKIKKISEDWEKKRRDISSANVEKVTNIEGGIKKLRDRGVVISADISLIEGKNISLCKLDTAYRNRIDNIRSHAEKGYSGCPVCGSEIDADKIIGIIDEEKNEINTSIENNKEDISELKKEAEKVRKEIGALENSIEELSAAYKAEYMAIDEKEKESITEIENEYSPGLKKLEEQLSAVEKAETLTERRLDREAGLNKIQIIDLEPLQENLEAKRNDRERLTERIGKLKIAENDARKKVQLEEDQFNQMQLVRCYGAIKKATGPKGIQGLLLRERIEPFIQSVNDILQRFAPDMEFGIQFEDDRGKESCQFGFTANGIHTLFESASGAEKTLILFAIVIALMNRQRGINQKIILMDEIASLDNEMVPTLVDAAKIATDANLLDFAVLAGALREADIERITEAQPEIVENMIRCDGLIPVNIDN